MTDERDEVEACPKCGKESDMMGYWFRVGSPSAWTCWDCNTMLPSIAYYQGRIELLMARCTQLQIHRDQEQLRAMKAEADLEAAKGADKPKVDIDEGVPNCGWGS